MTIFRQYMIEQNLESCGDIICLKIGSCRKAKEYSISGGPDQINGRKILKSGKFQIPIEHAMTLVMKERARHFSSPKGNGGQ